MMKKHFVKLFVLSFCLATAWMANAQNSILFEAGGLKVNADEFKRQFTKNLDLKNAKISEAELDEYLDLYVKFKLKLKDAYDNGVDTTEGYVQEMMMYRQQLAANYLIDKEVTEQLMKEAYDRMQYGIRAAHILIMFKPNYTNADTLEAWKKINSIYKDLMDGKISFADAAKQYSDDKGTSENGGDLGFFTSMQLVYPFENAAYETPVGSMSNVFRTTFGYHIVDVLDKQENKGDLNVSSILIRTGTVGKLTEAEAKKKIDDIYTSLKNGADFEELARKHSEDFDTKYSGGSMGMINISSNVGRLEMQELFKKANDLNTEGAVSEPFLNSRGWNIVRRGALKKLGDYSTMRSYLKTQIQNDERSKKSIQSLIEQIKKADFVPTADEKAVNFVASKVGAGFSTGQYKRADLPVSVKYCDVYIANSKGQCAQQLELGGVELFKIGGMPYSMNGFLDIIDMYYPKEGTKDVAPKVWIANLYESYKKEKLLQYQDEHLEEKNTDFRNIYQEYKEGILMFNRQQTMVWDKSNTDSAGLANFYEAHKNEYLWNDRFNLQVYNTNSKKDMKGVYKLMKKGWVPDSVLKKYNFENSLSIDYRTGKFEISDGFLLTDSAILTTIFNNPKYRSTNNKIYKVGAVNNDWIVAKVVEFMPKQPKKLAECRGSVAAKYQEELERNWLADLKNTYNVQINNAVLAQIKQELVNTK